MRGTRVLQCISRVLANQSSCGANVVSEAARSAGCCAGVLCELPSQLWSSQLQRHAGEHRTAPVLLLLACCGWSLLRLQACAILLPLINLHDTLLQAVPSPGVRSLDTIYILAQVGLLYALSMRNQH